MLSIVTGLIIVVIAFWGLITWWGDFLLLVRGLLPISFVFGGMVAIIAGIAGFSEKKKK